MSTAALREVAAAGSPPSPPPFVDRFQELYAQAVGAADGAAADAERSAREQALAELAAHGFPLRRDEEWIHTPVRPVVEAQYRLAAAPPAEELRELEVLNAVAGPVADREPVAVVTANGHLVRQLSTLDGTALELAPATRAPRTGDELPAGGFSRSLETAFTRVARAFAAAPLQLRVPANTRLAAPVHLVHLTAPGVLSAPVVQVHIGSGASVTLLESFATLAGEGGPSLSTGITELHLEPGAQLRYGRLQLDGGDAFNLGSTTVVQQRDSSLRGVSVALGGALSRHTVNVLAAESGTDSHLTGAAVVGGTGVVQLVDSHTFIEHAAEGCTSRQLYKVVLGAQAHGVFSGRIIVRPVAQRTDAFQLNNNLLLGDAQVDARPQLEIGADDVRCSHGATTGRLNEDELFYLRTRGIARRDATLMLARGFLDQAIADGADPALRQRIMELVHQRLARLASFADARTEGDS